MTNDIAIPKPPLLLLWATAVWTCAPSTVAAEETRHQLSWPLTNSSHEFAIGIGGSLDAENSGDYRHNNQFEVSRFIRIANRGDNHIVNPRIRANGHTDWWDVEQGLRDIIDPSMSDKEKALAIYWFVVSQRYHNPGDDGDLKDPIKFLGVYGYGFCTNTAILLAALWGSAGLESRFWRAHGHDVSEVWYDGGWHLLDGDIEVLYKLPDGHTIAGYEDLVADPFLVVRAPPYGQAYRDPWPGSDLAAQRHSGYFGGRAIPDQRYVTRRYATGHTLALTLIPDAVFTWSWVPLARFYTMPKWIGRPPRRYGSGRWEYAPDFRSGRWLYGADMAERVEAGRSGSLPMIRGTSASQPGRLKYSVRLPYVCVDGLMVGQVRVGDGGVVSITAKMDGSDRRELTWRWQKKGVMPFVLSLKDLVAPDARGASYGMSFEIVIEGGELTGLDSLRLVVDSQLASAALPRMRLGPNTLRVTHESAAPIDALLTYNWRERANVGLPYQAAEPVFPLEGAVVDSLSWTFEWTPALNPDGDPVVGYIFELSEYPDMRWPFGPEWVSEIKKGVTNDITSFTPPPHALVAPNRTYYWRVRARTTGRLWGRWSDVWSVSARGPGAPKRVRIEMVGDKPYLTWEPTIEGTSPVRYELYAGDVEGFMPSPEKYGWTAYVREGVPTVITRPANLIAATSSTYFEVSGTLRPASQYRLVAVDANNIRSAPSAPVWLHPYVWSAPPTHAALGSLYTYEPQTTNLLSHMEYRESNQVASRKVDDVRWEMSHGPLWLSMEDGVLQGSPADTDPSFAAVRLVGTGSVTSKKTSQDFVIRLSGISVGSARRRPASLAAISAGPNPFNPRTSIYIQMPLAGDVTVRVYNALGIEVAHLMDRVPTDAGVMTIPWEPVGLGSGVYWIKAQIGPQRLTATVVLKR